jgi:ABC-2 type transport system ATP-binding protein
MEIKNPVIQTHNLSKAYGDFQALKSLDLNVPENSIVGFLGPNGAGKSTTIKLLLGLSRPTAGSGTIFGLDIENQKQDIRRRVGYLTQNPLIFWMMCNASVIA